MNLNFLNSVERIVKMLEYGSVVVACFLVGIVFLDVISHKIFRVTFSFTWDISTLLFLIVISFALPKVITTEAIIKVEIIRAKVKGWIRSLLELVDNLLILFLSFLIAWRSFVFAGSLQASKEVSNTVSIPLYPFAYLITVGWSVIGIYFLLKLLERKKLLRKRR